MEDCPLVSLLVKRLRVVDHHLSDLSILGVFGFGAFEQRLKGQQGRLDGENRRPSGAEGVETDGALEVLSKLAVSMDGRVCSSEEVPGDDGRWGTGERQTYGLAADVGMPDLGVELHDGRTEGILGGDLDVDDVLAALVWSARGPGYASLEVCQVAAAVDGLGRDVGVGSVGSHVAQLLGDTAHPARRHGG